MNINDSFYLQGGKPIDSKEGPYLSLNDVDEKIPIEQRYKGLTFSVYENPENIIESKVIKYFFDENLEIDKIKKLSISNELIVNKIDNDINLEINKTYITIDNPNRINLTLTENNINGILKIISNNIGGFRIIIPSNIIFMFNSIQILNYLDSFENYATIDIYKININEYKVINSFGNFNYN